VKFEITPVLYNEMGDSVTFRADLFPHTISCDP